MKRTAEEAAKTRQMLIDAALDVFLRKGYADATIEDICQTAKTTRGAFYHYFDSKKAIYFALLEERYQTAFAMLFSILQSTGTPLTKLRELLTAYLGLLLTDKGFKEANELTLLKTGYVEELQEGMVTKVVNMRQFTGLLEDLLTKAVREKEIRLKTEPHKAALHLYAAITGTGSLWLIDSEYFDFPREAKSYVDLWLTGVMEN